MLFILLSLFMPFSLIAETHSTILTGANVNSWSQAGFQASDKPFDFAIQGKGFFVLQLSNGKRGYSRYGEMSLDADGYLIHSATRGKVLGYCDGMLQPVKLSRYAYDERGTVVRSFNTELNGKIMAFYESGYSNETCTLVLALFNNPSKLIRDNHLLISTPESGRALVGIPQSLARGSIYSSTLEELDEQIYRLNINPSGLDRVAVEMEKGRKATEEWIKKRIIFYVFDLNVSRQELAAIEKSSEEYESAIASIVTRLKTDRDSIVESEFSNMFEALMQTHESEVLNTLGKERFERAEKFRDDYNKLVWMKFGTGLQITTF